jgi:uncharacterized protein (TIGR03000 family)
MYSVVLMVAMTGGGDVPAGLFNHGCCGGGSCYGCYGGCYGCGGGGHHKRSHGGCHGNCYGGCYGNCYGGCYGCGGGGHHKHARRSHGCHGGCYGNCCGGCYGGGCYGSCYGGGCYGGGCFGTPVAPPVFMPEEKGKKTPSTSVDSAAPATIVVNVPADARLTIDGEATTSTSTQRVFVSPTLNAGREYHYTLKAEFVKDGKVVKLSKEIAVRAGNETRVQFAADGQTEIASR